MAETPKNRAAGSGMSSSTTDTDTSSRGGSTYRPKDGRRSLGSSGGSAGSTKTILLGTVAVIGWGLAAYFGFSRGQIEESYIVEVDRLETEFAAQEEAVGSIASLETRITELRPQLDDLEDRRLTLEGARDVLGEEVGTLTTQRDTLQQEIAAQQQTLEDLTTEAQPLREEIASHEDRVQELTNAIEQREQEIVEVGSRLEDLRQRETTLRETTAGLSEDNARLSDEVAISETELQGLIEQENELRQQVSTLQDETDSLSRNRSNLAQELERMRANQTRVEASLSAAEQQRSDLQNILVNMTGEVETRSNRLLEIEQQISEIEGAALIIQLQTDSAQSQAQEQSGGSQVTQQGSSDGRSDIIFPLMDASDETDPIQQPLTEQTTDSQIGSAEPEISSEIGQSGADGSTSADTTYIIRFFN